MLKDDRALGLATEFGGNWLDFRRFEELNTVDRERFPNFDTELRKLVGRALKQGGSSVVIYNLATGDVLVAPKSCKNGQHCKTVIGDVVAEFIGLLKRRVVRLRSQGQRRPRAAPVPL